MRTKLVSFDRLEHSLQADSGDKQGNRPQLRRMSAAMRAALQNELTDRQRSCMLLYYYQRKTMPQIASLLGIHKSTVCRHLQKGRALVRKAVSYACMEHSEEDSDEPILSFYG